MKAYDRAYFDHWYRSEPQRGHARDLARTVAMTVAVTEYHLQRPISGILDLGCGEGRWRAPLLRLRPRAHYLGFDASPYAVSRFGRSRNLHLARFGQFAELRPGPPADLLVCADVLHYLDATEVRRGLAGFAELCAGVAYVEVQCRGDRFEGDRQGFRARAAGWYRQRLSEAGFVAIGSHCYLAPALADGASALERS